MKKVTATFFREKRGQPGLGDYRPTSRPEATNRVVGRFQ